MSIIKSVVTLSLLFSLSFIVSSHVFAVEHAGLTIIEKPVYKIRPIKNTPTPTPIPVCLAEITYAKNPKNGKCQSFSSSCEVPKKWIQVDECPVRLPRPSKDFLH